MEKNEALLRLQKEFSDSAPNVRKICELMIQLGYENDLKSCFSLEDLKGLWQRINVI